MVFPRLKKLFSRPSITANTQRVIIGGALPEDALGWPVGLNTLLSKAHFPKHWTMAIQKLFQKHTKILFCIIYNYSPW